MSPDLHKAPVSPSLAQTGLGGGQQLLSLERPCHMPGQGQEMSSASEEPGDPVRNVAASIPALCSLQAKVSFLWEWQGTAFPRATGAGTCKCLKLELL